MWFGQLPIGGNPGSLNKDWLNRDSHGSSETTGTPSQWAIVKAKCHLTSFVFLWAPDMAYRYACTDYFSFSGCLTS